MSSWAPEAKPQLLMSASRRYRIRRTAKGYAVYDHARGRCESLHNTMGGALYHKSLLREKLRHKRDNQPEKR
jgi:hypothetical protein